MSLETLLTAINGFWKRIENTQAWNESVTMNSSSWKPHSHCSTVCCMRSAKAAVLSFAFELALKGTKFFSSAFSLSRSIFRVVKDIVEQRIGGLWCSGVFKGTDVFFFYQEPRGVEHMFCLNTETSTTLVNGRAFPYRYGIKTP